MKKHILKAISFTMVLSLLAVAFILPTNAAVAGSSAGFSMNLTKVTDMTDAEGNSAATLDNIYKLTVSMNSNVPLNAIQLAFTYDSTKLYPCWGTPGDGIFFNYPANPVDGTPETAYTPLNTLANANQYNGTGSITTVAPQVKFYGPAHASAKATYKFENLAPGGEQYNTAVTGAGYDAASVTNNIGVVYTKFACNNALAKGTIMPFGQEELYSMYFQAKGDVTGAEFRFTLVDMSTDTNAGYKLPALCPGGTWTGATSNADSVETKNTQNGNSYTFGGAPVVGPTVAKEISQAKFYGTKPNADDNFDYRLISKITDADWDTYFANTAAGSGNNRITKVGFVARDKANGAFDKATAEAVAKGIASEGYFIASTTYISKAGDAADAMFGCRIENILHSTQTTDIDCLAFVEYVDVAGATQYIFYDAAVTAAVATGYDASLAQWKAA